MQKLPTKLLMSVCAGLLLSACAQKFPANDELPSSVSGHLEGQQVLLKVSFEASEDSSFQCASKLVAEQASVSALENVVRTDRPEANRAVSFSKTLKFKGEELDTLFIALSQCRFADQTGVRWSTLRWSNEKLPPMVRPLLAPPPPPPSAASSAPAAMPVPNVSDLPPASGSGN
ncbi:MAG: hypothetical protein CFE39_12585 [Comamonadaceae bacterium PBBC2]|nr:MAG: hypothetical protein CFE39_12585 [Comamonadaceae bacterium PBBC2]